MHRPQIALIGEECLGVISDELQMILPMMKILDDRALRAEAPEFVEAVIDGEGVGSASSCHLRAATSGECVISAAAEQEAAAILANAEMIVAGIAKDLSFGVLALDAVVPAAAVELVEADELIAEGRTIHTCDEVGSVAMPLFIEKYVCIYN